jgi:endonuclease/exonuclease/phosphatase family metal-dependent hydrolase
MQNRVRVATYNVYLGADLSLLLGQRTVEELDRNRYEVQRQLMTTAFPMRADAIARVLERQRLDLVGLQEVCTWTANGEPLWDFAAELLRALQRLGEPFEVVAGQPTFEGSGRVRVDGRPLELWLQGSNTVLRRCRSAIDVESSSVGLFRSAHTTPLLDQLQVSITRGWCAVRCRPAGTPETGFTFVNTHTEAYDEDARDRQRDELLAVLPAEGERVVLVGDFNAPPARVGMPAEYQDAWVAAGNPSDRAASATGCQAPDLLNEHSVLAERLDYVWTRGVRVVSARRFGADPEDRAETGLWPSDHAGVVAELEV